MSYYFRITCKTCKRLMTMPNTDQDEGVSDWYKCPNCSQEQTFDGRRRKIVKDWMEEVEEE